LAFSFRSSHQHPVNTSTLPHTCYMTRPSHSSRFDHPRVLDEKCKSLSSSLCSFLHSLLPVGNHLQKYRVPKLRMQKSKSVFLTNTDLYFCFLCSRHTLIIIRN
jgi:hypothetical protein